jgi:hypothetical protein
MTDNSVFISYSRRDSAYVGRLVEFLRANQIPAWADSAINYGDHWEDVIVTQIDSCAAFVPVMTPAAWSSPWVRNEVARARQKDKPILPLLLAGEIFFGLSHVEAEDVTNGQLPTPQFVARLQHIVGVRPAGTLYQPQSTEDRRTRRWLWPVVAAAAAVLLIVGVVVAVTNLGGRPVPHAGATPPTSGPPSLGPTPPEPTGAVIEHLTAPLTIGRYTLLYQSPTPSAQPTDGAFGYQVLHQTGVAVLLYHDPADPNKQVELMAVTGDVQDYKKTVDVYLTGVDESTVASVNPGRLSGVAKCGTASEHKDFIYCVWTDPGSLGVLYCYSATQADCATLLVEVRDAVLSRD